MVEEEEPSRLTVSALIHKEVVRILKRQLTDDEFDHVMAFVLAGGYLMPPELKYLDSAINVASYNLMQEFK